MRGGRACRLRPATIQPAGVQPAYIRVCRLCDRFWPVLAAAVESMVPPHRRPELRRPRVGGLDGKKDNENCEPRQDWQRLGGIPLELLFKAEPAGERPSQVHARIRADLSVTTCYVEISGFHLKSCISGMGGGQRR